jgi:hypothetical protein
VLAGHMGEISQQIIMCGSWLKITFETLNLLICVPPLFFVVFCSPEDNIWKRDHFDSQPFCRFIYQQHYKGNWMTWQSYRLETISGQCDKLMCKKLWPTLSSQGLYCKRPSTLFVWCQNTNSSFLWMALLGVCRYKFTTSLLPPWPIVIESRGEWKQEGINWNACIFL